MRVLDASTWLALERTHFERAEALTASHRARRLAGQKHPIEDFLWTYYSVKPTELARWHPGAGVVLQGAAEAREAYKHYAVTGEANADAIVDLAEFFAKRGQTVDFVERLIEGTMGRQPRYGCFGLHEWAMVYRMTPEQLRHTALPLRLGHERSNEVVESHTIGCTHFDAFRFFTPEARPLNTIELSRAEQENDEQAGCLHAGMDLYKWCTKLVPIVPSELVLDAFVLARDIREIDMRASPYDVTGYSGADGTPLTPVPVETPDGKREYAHLQRGFTARGNALRDRMLAAISLARATHAAN